MSARAADWAVVGLLCACALLSGILEVLFIPTYIAGVVAPFVVLGAVVGNVLFPRLAYGVVPTTTGLVLPVLAWLLPVLGLTLVARPEGDVIVSGSQSQPYVFYGMLILGAATGFASIALRRTP